MVLLHGPLALGFLAPWWWALWLLAAALPLVIHLWSRRRWRETEWAAMPWLLAALRRNARRLRLEQWLLLLVRTAVIVLLVLALLRPYLQRPGVLAGAGVRTHHILVLDGSFSMAAAPGQRSWFEAARQRAVQLVDAAAPGDAFTLLLLSDPPRQEIREPSGYREEVKQLIQNMELPHGRADLLRTVEQVQQTIARAKASDPGLKQTVVYFFSDLGRASWLPGEGGAAARSALRQQSDALVRSADRVQVIDVAGAVPDNLAISDVRPADRLITAGRRVRFVAELRSYARQTVSRQQVGWYLDGRRQGTSVVEDLPPGGQPRLTEFDFQFDQPGEHWIEARLENPAADVLAVDDRRWYALSVSEALSVLCVDGKSSGDPFGGATAYLVRAVAPRPNVPNRVRVVPTVIRDGDLIDQDLSRYDAVFFCNVGQFSAGEARMLDAYLQQGGGVVFFLGDRVQPESYNRYLGGQEENQPRLLPARVGPPSATGKYAFDPANYEHPVVRPFKGRERAGLLTVPVYQYQRLEVLPQAEARVALRFDNGDAAIVEGPVHRGRVAVVATAASLESVDESGNPWTVWAQSPAFVPVVQELLALVVGTSGQPRNLQVGQPLVASVQAPGAEVSVQVLGPADETTTADRPVLRSMTLTSEGRWEFPDTHRSGLYTLRLGAPVDRTEHYAVNPPAAGGGLPESDLTRLTPEELQQDISPGFHETSSTGAADEAGPPTDLRAGGEVHAYLLWAVFGLLLLESGLAWRLGRVAV